MQSPAVAGTMNRKSQEGRFPFANETTQTKNTFQTMKASSNNILLFRLAGMVVVCLAVPPLLHHYLGPAVGALSALGACGFWYSQYRLPSWKERAGASFWFVAGGYFIIGMTLLFSLGGLSGVQL